MKLDILITGADGFIGSSLAKALNDCNLLLLSRSKIEDKGISGNWVNQDLLKPLNLNKLPKKLDIIIHEAAKVGSGINEGDRETWRINVEATKELLAFGKKVKIKKFIFASTSAVYGTGDSPFIEEASLNPENYYAKTKVMAEEEVKKFSSYFDTTIFRYVYPYGSYSSNKEKRGIHKIIEKVINEQIIDVYNKDNPSRTNPIYIDDLCRLTKNSFNLRGSQVINLGGNEEVSFKQIAAITAEIIGKKPRYQYIDDKTKKSEIGNITQMKKLLGVPIFSIRKGLDITIRNLGS